MFINEQIATTVTTELIAVINKNHLKSHAL